MRKKGVKKVFNPSYIQTRIAKALDRDLRLPTQVYGNVRNAKIPMLRERQALEFSKKFVDNSSGDDDLETITYIKFLLVNQHMANFGREALSLPADHMLYPQSRYSARDNILLRARAIIRSVLSPFTNDDWIQSCKHSSGTSIGVSFSDTSLEAKSTFPFTVTAGALSVMTDFISSDKQFEEALLEFNSCQARSGPMFRVVTGSRATTVPKSTTIKRMIAVEPTANMFLQQGLMALMYERMKVCGLDVKSLPEEHRKRAWLASITSNEATVDWSSASDCVAIELLKWLIPPRWFIALDTVRSDHILIQDVPVRLNMFSTMGNAGTFPLETLVFWSLAHATLLEAQGTLTCFPELENLRDVSVFGDDCIVPSDIAHDFIEVCGTVGFIVNENKTFIDDGGFRESCGGDYYHGYDVRPYNIKAPRSRALSQLEPWLYTILNSLIPKYVSCFGELSYVYDQELFREIFAIFKEYHIAVKLVPPYYPIDSGLSISDIERFWREYGQAVRLSRIGVSNQGLHDFRYCRFQYRLRKDRVDSLHYHMWLKRPHSTWINNPDPDGSSKWWTSKKIGGYVVAKGKSSCWSLPASIFDKPLV